MNKLPIPKEEDDQKALAELLDSLKLTWFHVPNEGKRKPQYNAKLKKLGLKSGVPDVIILDEPPNFPGAKGAAIELKRKKYGRLSENQLVWIQLFQFFKWKVKVCHGIDEAIDQLKEWGYMK